MAKSRGRKFAEITSPSSGVFDLTSVPTITNAKLQNSAMTLAGSSVSLGGTGVADTDALSEGSSNVYFTNARVQTFLGGGTLAGNIVVPDNRSIYLGSDSDFRMVHNTNNTQLINATGALQITSNGGFDVTGAATFSSTGTFAGNILPSADSTHDIGTSANRFANAYFDTMYGTVGTAAQPNITSVGTLTSLTVSGNATAQNVINIATDSTIQTTSANQWATIKNTSATGYSEMKISNDNNDYLIMGSIGSSYSSADWSSSSYIYANRELRIKSQQGLRFYSGGFTHGTNDYMILESAGNLGIGITSGISSKLHVNTEMSLGPDGNNRGIINYSSNILSFGTRQSSTNYFSTVNITGGSVGIGTSAPGSFVESSRFVVGSGTSGVNEMMFLYSGTNAFGALGFADGTSGTARYMGIIGYHHSDNELFFSTNGGGEAARAMTITSDGRVGIGTETPGSYDTNSGGISADLVVANSGHSGIVVVSGTSSDAGIFFGDGTGNDAYKGAVSYVNSQDRLYFKAAGSNKMTLDTNTLNAMGINLDVGVDTATVNFTDSVSNGNTKYIEIGANGASSLGDALLVTHCSGSGVGYFGYESGNDRLIIACDNGGGNNKIDLSVTAGTGTGGSTDNINAATPALRVHGNGNVGIHGVTSPYADLHVGHGGQEWRTTHGGSSLYTTNTSWGGDLTGDPNFYYGAPSGILVTSTDSSTTGPTYPGVTLYNNDNTAGGWSPMLIFAKAESGSSPYKASMAAIYARAPLGTGNGDSWIDGELWFGTSGAATNGVRGRMVLEKEGHLRPASDNTYDLGTTSYRWRNVYTTDLHLSNKVPEGTVGTDGEAIDVGNDVDGTTGDWTIQEGAEDLYIINNSTGKKYKFNLTEV